MVAFVRNLVINISTEKHHIQYPICTLLVKIRCKFKAHFGWKCIYFFQLTFSAKKLFDIIFKGYYLLLDVKENKSMKTYYKKDIPYVFFRINRAPF